jgi:hypothetical protein
MSAAPVIVVAGDVCIDWFATPVSRVTASGPPPGQATANWQFRDGLRMFARPGGAWLLADLVAKVTGLAVVQQAAPAKPHEQDCESALHSMVELKAFARVKGDKERKNQVWRVERFRGFAGPTTGDSGKCQVPVTDDNPAASLVVLDDVGNGFRECRGSWPKALEQGGSSPWIVWKMARPLGGGQLAEHLLAHHVDRTIAVLDVDDLRSEGAAISRQLSWERTAGDVIHALTHDPHFNRLRELAHLVVRFDLEAALHLSGVGTEATSVELTYLPGGIEGSTRADVPGDMLGFTSVFVAQLVAALARKDKTSLSEQLRAGIKAGLTEARRLSLEGFGLASGAVAELPSWIRADVPASKELTSVNVAPLAGRNPGSRLLDYVRTEPLDKLAADIVTVGIRGTIPAAPVAKFGGLETLDRTEIETFRSVRNLIGEYLAQASPERPLSLAVFGPPGSGKSFGVAQVAKSLGDVEKLEFNVSQFEGVDQLTTAFHGVRDAVVRGRVPLVFFDEFDAAAPGGQALGWLKHFLAPMQDGKFSDGDSVHLIGRAIFVFAGGTSHMFSEFARLAEKDFREAKGPDFVSRLRGYVDVRGTDRREPGDAIHIIRRAVLLRSLLQRKAPAIFDPTGCARLDAGVRRAFLRCRSFRHGARSMEAILDMSLLTGREVFERACLPSEQQLDLQVDACEFLDLVAQDVALHTHRQQIAQAIHALFLRQQTGKKPADDPSMQPWESLSGNYREDNHAQAADIPRKLDLIHCAYQAVSPNDGLTRLTLTENEVEILAAAEHERWNDSKRAQGYRYGPTKDAAAQTHPCLLPWCDLPKHEKDKDRDTVRAIPEFMEMAGFRVVRLT